MEEKAKHSLVGEQGLGSHRRWEMGDGRKGLRVGLEDDADPPRRSPLSAQRDGKMTREGTGAAKAWPMETFPAPPPNWRHYQPLKSE